MSDSADLRDFFARWLS